MLEPKLGQWLPPEEDKIALGVAIVELAMKHGYDINKDAWEADKPVFLSGDISDEMLEDLQVVADFSLQYLEEQLPDGYAFWAGADGLILEKKI